MPKDYVMAFNEGILADKRPNFFELVAEEAMHETLRPAIEYICKVAHKTQQASIQWNLFEGTSLVSMATMYSIKVAGEYSCISVAFHCIYMYMQACCA